MNNQEIETLGRLVTFFIAFNLAFIIGAAVNFLIAAVTSIHCCNKGPQNSRTAWVITIIAFPYIGWIAYWFTSQRDDLNIQSRSSGVFPPAPPPPTTQSIAAEINAEIAARPKGPRWIGNQPR